MRRRSRERPRTLDIDPNLLADNHMYCAVARIERIDCHHHISSSQGHTAGKLVCLHRCVVALAVCGLAALFQLLPDYLLPNNLLHRESLRADTTAD